MDLEWWVENLEKANGKEFFPKIQDMGIYSDASLSGWGAIFNGVTTRGPWTTEQTSMHINSLELLGAIFALQSFAKDSQVFLSKCIWIILQRCLILTKGGRSTKSAELTRIAKELTNCCEQRRISITANHLAGGFKF
jgi:hypothetical protein